MYFAVSHTYTHIHTYIHTYIHTHKDTTRRDLSHEKGRDGQFSLSYCTWTNTTHIPFYQKMIRICDTNRNRTQIKLVTMYTLLALKNPIIKVTDIACCPYLLYAVVLKFLSSRI